MEIFLLKNLIKKNIKNQTVILSENQQSFYVNYEPIKEYNIYNIERRIYV